MAVSVDRELPDGDVGVVLHEVAEQCLRPQVLGCGPGQRSHLPQVQLRRHRALVGGRGPAAALRQAQLDLMRLPAYRHPYYWAPFVVVGVGE